MAHRRRAASRGGNSARGTAVAIPAPAQRARPGRRGPVAVAAGSVANDQGYQLDLAPKVITIKANAAPAGLFYGIETLVQLLKKDGSRLQLPEGRIVDWPDLAYRAIYWDDAHHLDRPEH